MLPAGTVEDPEYIPANKSPLTGSSWIQAARMSKFGPVGFGVLIALLSLTMCDT
jgi:hypothetical protein